MINTLLVIWFLIWLYKQFPSESIKSKFERKIKGGQWGYAQMEAETFVAKELREELRKEMDRLNESVDAYQKQVDNKANKEETKKLFEEKVKEINKVIAELVAQIGSYDSNIKEAEDNADKLHHQEELLKTYLEQNY
jgi:chromosome segregation ATPase